MLRGIDQVTNVILEDVEERIFSMERDMEVEKYDVYLFRGDDMYPLFDIVLIISALVALYNDEKDNETEWRGIRAEPIGAIVHCIVFSRKQVLNQHSYFL